MAERPSFTVPTSPWQAHRRPAIARTVDGLKAVDAEDWNRLVPPGSGGLRHGFLRAWECCELPGLRSRPLLLSEAAGGPPLAAAAAYSYDLDLVAVDQLAPAWLTELVRRAFPRLMIARVFELGSPTADVEPLLIASNLEHRPAIEAMLDAALDDADELGALLTIVQDRIAPHGPLAAALRRRRFAEVRILPTTILENGFATFEEYVAALRTKYRSRTRQILRQSEHLSVERTSDFGSMAAEFGALWRLVYEQADETRREVLGEPFFAAAAAVPETSAIVLRRADGSVAAFGLLLEDAPWSHFLQCGFDPVSGRDESIYFRLLLEVVRAGIDTHSRFIHLGCTTLAPKLRVGAEAFPLSAWVRHRNPVMNRALQVIAAHLRPPPAMESHRVFAARR